MNFVICFVFIDCPIRAEDSTRKIIPAFYKNSFLSYQNTMILWALLLAARTCIWRV